MTAKDLKDSMNTRADEVLASFGLQRRRRGSDAISALQWVLLGAAVGGVAALLFAPRTGEELRSQLTDKMQTARDKALQAASKARESRANGLPGEITSGRNM